MAGDIKKTSQLGIATTLANTDRVVVLTNPSSTAQTQTITVNNFISSMRYANTSAAGVIKLGDNLTINATGHVSSFYPAYANVTVAGIVKVGNNLTINATGYLTANTTGSWTFDGTKAYTGGTSNAYIDGQTPGGLILYQDYGVTLIANTAAWNFNEDSTVTFPGCFGLHTKDYTELYTVSTGQANKDIDIYTGGFQANSVEVWLRHANGVYIYTENGQYGWKFGNDGILNISGAIHSDNEIDIIAPANHNANTSYGYQYIGTNESGLYNQNDRDNTWSWLGTNISDSEEPYVFIENNRGFGANTITNRWVFDLHGNFSLPANSTVGSEGGFHIENATTISANAITIHNNIFDDLNRPLINVNALDINADGGTPATVFGPSDTVFDGGAGTTVFGLYESALDGGVSFNNRHSATFIDGGGAANQF